jgi:hypothetical protein
MLGKGKINTMDEKVQKSVRGKFRKGIKVVHIAHSIVMDSFDEINDFNDFMKSAITREQNLTANHLEKGASGL